MLDCETLEFQPHLVEDWPDNVDYNFADARSVRVVSAPDGSGELVCFFQVCTGGPVKRVYRLDTIRGPVPMTQLISSDQMDWNT
jgi:hypothetical protein